jgi:hypothetical protein
VRVAHGSWGERRITFANAPEALPRFVRSGPLRKRAWKALDVTSLASGERGITLVVMTESRKGVAFASRETGFHGPRLVVERADAETTTSTEAKPS